MFLRSLDTEQSSYSFISHFVSEEKTIPFTY